MESSFPQNEYQTFENQKKLLDNPNYHLLAKDDENGNLTAFMAYWDLPEFSFIEHLAVNPNCRGMGLGSKIITEFIKSYNKTIVLEIEVPHDEISTKRLRFYEKLGFALNTNEYYQLPLRENSTPMKMYLMSYPQKLSDTDFDKIKHNIYKYIYKRSDI